MLDDVCYIDDYGVPRASSGRPAEILEYSNSIQEMWEEIRQGLDGAWYQFPLVFVPSMLDTACCHRVALANYGDSPHCMSCASIWTRPCERASMPGLSSSRPTKSRTIVCATVASTRLISWEIFTSPSVHFLLGAIFRIG